MYDIKAVRENFNTFRKLLSGTDAEKHFDEKYAFAYIECQKELPDGGIFVSFQTGYNRDTVVSFVKDNTGIYVKTGYRRNYGGYNCSCDGEKITEIHNYGFGSKEIIRYNLNFRKLSSEQKQEYGCCCG